MIVIGLVGEKRGGKGTFTELLQEALPNAQIECLRFSDIIGDILKILDIPCTRDNMQKLPVGLMRTFNDNSVITKAMERRIRGQVAHIVILDGIRTHPDVQTLKKFPENLLIYVTASQEIRYQRALKATEKVGENKISFEEFKKQDEAEIEKMIPVIGSTADHIVFNEGSLAEYRDEVRIIRRDFNLNPAE